MTQLNRLISHRFRGFSDIENTISGLKAALDFGVKIVEFDIRVSKCGTPIIYHDEHARDASGKLHTIANLMASDLSGLGGDFAHMPGFAELLDVARSHTNRAKLLIDIKDAGFEEEIHALVMERRLSDRVTYVSWIPNVLYRLHKIAPDIPLCLSHWCRDPNAMIRAYHKVHTAKAGHVPRLAQDYIHGERSGWFIDGPLRGELRDILKACGGSVCVPQDMVSADLVANYHRDSIPVSTFSYVDWKSINNHAERFNIDLYFIDNKKVFETYVSDT